MLAKATDRMEPPEAHMFIRDARRAENAGNHRRAVLDAATAAEIAFAELRDEAVKTAEPGLRAYIERRSGRSTDWPAF